jgi:inosine/xanthosine triphosphatase
MPANSVNIAVASTNPVKIEAARRGFQQAFPKQTLLVQGFSVSANTPDQPIGDRQTYQGACSRIAALQQAAPDFTFFVGIEGGVEKDAEDGYASFAWIVLGNGRQQYTSRTATFPLPPAVCRLLDEGLELGDADDRVFGCSQSKLVNGAVGLLTADRISRTDLLAQSVFLALIPYQNQALFQ